jgi:hypothetical protein
LTLKKRESRQRLKAQSTTLLAQNLGSTAIPEKVVDIQAVVDLAGVVDQKKVVDDASTKVVDNNRLPVVDQKQIKKEVIEPNLIQLFQT